MNSNSGSDIYSRHFYIEGEDSNSQDEEQGGNHIYKKKRKTVCDSNILLTTYYVYARVLFIKNKKCFIIEV